MCVALEIFRRAGAVSKQGDVVVISVRAFDSRSTAFSREGYERKEVGVKFGRRKKMMVNVNEVSD